MASDREKGCGFLVERCGSRRIAAPETMSDELRQIAQSTRAFSVREVKSLSERIEAQESGLMRTLLAHAAGAGLLMAGVPEGHGGLGLGQLAQAVIAENVTHQGSYVVAQVCHTGIGTLPLICYGNEHQRERYLPMLASGELIGAFALTEADAGTDVKSIRSRAVASADGSHFKLSGEKIFCTNGGIADIFTVFARLEGSDGISAFIVERDTPGFSVGREERKMGICGSSTTPLAFDDALVPAENLLGRQGQGHEIAHNILGAGRLMLAAACTGQIKRVIEESAPYAKSRTQFGRPIAEFELVSDKLAWTAINAWLLESVVWRTAGQIDSCAKDSGLASALSEFSIETSIAKVLGSESLFNAADDALQLFGGYGYICDFPAESRFRDCRINRIFEGTNEIIRLHITNSLIKRAASGEIGIMERIGRIMRGADAKDAPETSGGRFEDLVECAESLKQIALYVAGLAAERYGRGLVERQSISAIIADLVIAAYAFDSGLSRLLTAETCGQKEKASMLSEAFSIWASRRTVHLLADAEYALSQIFIGDKGLLNRHASNIRSMSKAPSIDASTACRKIAERVLMRGSCDL